MIELLTAVLVAITAFYAWATFRILQANEKVVSIMREQSEALSRPYVSINTFLVPKSSVVYLRICNIGKTAAIKLRLELDRDFYKYGQSDERRNLAGHSAFQDTIDCFPPNAELVFALAQGFVIFGSNSDPNVTPPSFSIKATYSYAQKTVTEVTSVDLKPYLYSQPEPSPLLDRLEGIEKAIGKISIATENE
jgi:hypothetical protein